MTDQSIATSAAGPESDARDLLARLYREIGILAVTAALEVTGSKSAAAKDQDTAHKPLESGLAA